jgi:protein-tyrosine-phosphatase/predicted ATP-grasp superfamily ATP-dependent carboligase
VLQKPLTVMLAKKSGVPVPETYEIATMTDLETLRETLLFPLVGKPANKFSSHTSGVRYFKTFEELRQAFEVDPEFGTHMLLQEYCQGEGVGLEVLLHNRAPIAIFQHRRLKELPSTGGVSVVAVSEAPDPVLVHYAVELLRMMEWEGVAMVEFRRDRVTQTVKLMEVNGRYWGSLSLSCMAGIDFPFYEWQLAHGQCPEVPASYTTDLRMRWTSGEFRRLFRIFAAAEDNRIRQTSRWKELAGCVCDLFPPTRDALWSVTDPRPALQDLSYGLSDGLKKLLRSIVPSVLFEIIRIYHRIGLYGEVVYVKQRLRRALGIQRRPCTRMSTDVGFILFVCHGNIIRSPMAAALLRRQLAQVDSSQGIVIDSAGTRARPGGADSRAREVATEFGITLEGHRAQPLTADIVKRADVIFVMDFLNEAELLRDYPEAAHKVFILGEYSQKLGSEPAEIKDPYNGDVADIRRCYHILDSHIQIVAAMLSSPH